MLWKGLLLNMKLHDNIPNSLSRVQNPPEKELLSQQLTNSTQSEFLGW